MELNSKILVTGHRGLVGSAVVRSLRARGHTNVLTLHQQGEANPEGVTDGGRFDFRHRAATKWAFSAHRPEYVFHCAAKVGGIKGNAENQAAFLTDNLAIQNNVITSAHEYGVKKFLFLGSSCIYPRDCPQPIKEEYLLTGPLEKTNEGYALAKIAGIKLCQFLHTNERPFISAMPCNMFGINDKFDPHGGHVIPGMMARMHAAKVEGREHFQVWGDPNTKRELCFSDDLAKSLLGMMQNYDQKEPLNVGSGFELTMTEIASAVAGAVGFQGYIVSDTFQPSGTPRKLMDNSKADIWFHRTNTCFLDALHLTYDHYLSTLNK